MAKVVVTIKIMPASPEVNLEALKEKALKEITDFNDNKETKDSIEPIAFGLKAINIIFVMEEAKGSPDPVAEKISAFEEVNSAEITDVRRAIG
ncbi:MAG: elongation factor 1-beta [Nanoarchaeota archaeon]|nr:elongation factor 1-beta [Nanoarchaeota archaeon]